MHTKIIHMAADKYGVETKSIRNLLPELLKMSDKYQKYFSSGRKAEMMK